MKRTSLVATLTSAPSDSGDEIRALPEGVDYLEVRDDLVGRVDPEWLRDRFPGRLIYTLRSKAEGGGFEGGKRSRRKRLSAAVESYDLVDLEAERDLEPELLVAVPPEQRLLSWHGSITHLTELRGRFEKVSTTPARYYKLIPTAKVPADATRALALLKALRREDVICFAAGESGAWTRLLAPRMGSPLVYGAFGEIPGAPGQISVQKLVTDYGLPHLPEAEGLYGIVGNPVMHSLSPRLHNGAYRALGVPALYVPFHVESFGDFWLDIVEEESLDQLDFPLRGLSVTSPYKELALACSGVSSPRAQHVAAANTLVRDADGVWEAETTDPDGVSLLLQALGVKTQGCKAAVVGCGGAGRASAYGLQLAGFAVTLVNRGIARGERAAQEMLLPFVPLADMDPGDYDVLVHATALGHHDGDDLPFDLGALRKDATVIDLVYGARPTRLIQELRERGIQAAGGRRVLLYQALEQFRLLTGRELNEALASDLLGLETSQ